MTTSNLQDTDFLPHAFCNPDGGPTILLVHGAFSNRKEFVRCVGYIPSTYHILIPDLPEHGSSAHIAPFGLDLCTAQLAALIRARAHSGQAHVVGMSLGAHVVAHLATTHPELVLSVFASGFNKFARTIFTPVIPTVFYALSRIAALAPFGATPSLDVDEPPFDVDTPPTRFTHALVSRVTATLVSDAPIAPISPRMLVVAAQKLGALGDRVKDARRLGEAGKAERSRAVQHKGITHPWHVEEPKLFSETVQLWIEQRELPEPFEDIF